MIDANLIANYGFPIAVTCYLLYERSVVFKAASDKYDDTSKKLTCALTELSTTIRERMR